jgi:hypothetical protein
VLKVPVGISINEKKRLYSLAFAQNDTYLLGFVYFYSSIKQPFVVLN